MVTAEEDQQSQLTWTLGSSQRLNHQPKCIQGLGLGLFTCVADVQLGLHVDPKQLEQWLWQKLLPAVMVCIFLD